MKPLYDPTIGVAAPEEAFVFPAPLVSSRDNVDKPAPGVVMELARHAEACGWMRRVQYSRGCMPHAITGKPGPVKDWWAVRLRRPDWGAYATHDGANWHMVVMWGERLPPFPLAGLTELKVWLRDPGACGAAWFDAIRAKVAAQKARAKARPVRRKASETGL